MRIGRLQRRSLLATHQGEAAILFSVAGYVFAISASGVAEIQSLRELKPLPFARSSTLNSKVKYILERECGTYFVVDAHHHFHLPQAQSTRVLLLRDSRVALKVDAIERMTEIETLLPLPAAFQGQERQWYRGLALIGNQVVPAVNTASFLSRFEQRALERALSPAKSVERAGVLA